LHQKRIKREMGIFESPFGMFGESAFGRRPESRANKEPRKAVR